MDSPDLFTLRKNFTEKQIMLCFNGPISRSLIEEIGIALKNYLTAEHAQPSEAMDVFAVYIEATQNIRHYTMLRGYADADASATVVISRNESGRYVVSAGNTVEAEDGRVLVERIGALARLDKTELKRVYKEQLRKPRDPEAGSGAGLGLIDIARKATVPLAATVTNLDDGRVFFSLCAVI